MGDTMQYLRRIIFALVLCLLPSVLWAIPWQEPVAEFRRSIQMSLEESRITGEELVSVRFMGNGKQKPDEADYRVVTVAGKTVTSRLVGVRPGDEVEIVFNAQKGVRDYFVYFAMSKPRGESTPALGKGGLNRGGLLLEVRASPGRLPENAAEFESAFNRSDRVIGRRVIPRPFIGANPFGNAQPSISRASGKLYAPLEGDYILALSAHERGAIYIDGKPLVYARHQVGDVRFQGHVQLDRGWHDFALFQITNNDHYLFSAGWKRPDTAGYDVIGREFFGLVAGATAGPLEQPTKPVTADAKVTYQGECFVLQGYLHRYRFEVASTLRNPERLQCTWDFGDGQTASGREVEHVFLTPRTYPVTVTVKTADHSDTQTFRLEVDRNWETIARPPTDEPALQSRAVVAYDLSKLPPEQTPWAVLLHLRAGNLDAAIAAAKAMALAPKGGDRPLAMKALGELTDVAIEQKAAGRLREVYDAIPKDSDLQPQASIAFAGVLMYQQGQFPAAMKVIERVSDASNDARRVYGQALLLNGRMEEATKVLEGLPVAVGRQKAAALAGAMARTTEFYVEEKDVEHGEEAWEKWMAAFPAEFLEGNAVLLRVKLMQLRGNTVPASRLAEAYANANPKSAYASRLLNEAAKLLEKSDPTKSAELKQTLKQRYPEDPLSQ